MDYEIYCFVEGDFVAVYWSDKWVRGYIERPDPSGERSVVRLLDYGGYWQFNNSQCRPLLYNYFSLPFQAIEVFLANIQPKNGNYVLILCIFFSTLCIILFYSKIIFKNI